MLCLMQVTLGANGEVSTLAVPDTLMADSSCINFSKWLLYESIHSMLFVLCFQWHVPSEGHTTAAACIGAAI